MKIRSNKSPDEFHGNLQFIMAGIGMYMLHRLFRYVTTTGWYLVGSIEGA